MSDKGIHVGLYWPVWACNPSQSPTRKDLQRPRVFPASSMKRLLFFPNLSHSSERSLTLLTLNNPQKSSASQEYQSLVLLRGQNRQSTARASPSSSPCWSPTTRSVDTYHNCLLFSAGHGATQSSCVREQSLQKVSGRQKGLWVDKIKTADGSLSPLYNVQRNWQLRRCTWVVSVFYQALSLYHRLFLDYDDFTISKQLTFDSVFI